MTRPEESKQRRVTRRRRVNSPSWRAPLGSAIRPTMHCGGTAMRSPSSRDGESPLLADVLRWQGSVLRDRGRTSEAEPLYARSLEVATAHRLRPGRRPCAELSWRRWLNDAATSSRAAGLVTDALVVADRCGDQRLMGMLQQNLGLFADIRGNPAAALAHYRLSLRIFESIERSPAHLLGAQQSRRAAAQGERYDEACGAFDRAIGISRARGDLMSEGILEENRAELELIRGAIDAAYRAAHARATRWRTSGGTICDERRPSSSAARISAWPAGRRTRWPPSGRH